MRLVGAKAEAGLASNALLHGQVERLLRRSCSKQKSGVALRRTSSSECILPLLAELREPLDQGGD